jgi:hypothetical protein
LLLAKAMGTMVGNQRRPVAANPTAQENPISNPRKEYPSFKAAVIQGETIPNISHIKPGVNIDMQQICNDLVNTPTEITLKVILGIGQENKWEVKWAGVLEENSGDPRSSKHQTQIPPKPYPLRPIEVPSLSDFTLRPKPIQPKTLKPDPNRNLIWRLRVSGHPSLQKNVEDASGSTPPTPNLNHVSVHNCDSDSQISTHSSLIPASHSGCRPITEIMQGFSEVNRSWGSSSDRFLDLKDGRRIRFPVNIPTPMTDPSQAEEAVTHKLLQWASSL